MHYVSTRGLSGPTDFEGALLAGLAPDGGLYLPESWPQRSPQHWAGLAGAPYHDLAARMLAPFAAPCIAADELAVITAETYAGFANGAVAPLVQIGPNDFVLELFHGPTLAFKDFALQLLGRLFSRALARTGRRATILAATSGDTGSAALAAMAGRANVNIVVLHPKGRVSDIQRRQMTTVDAPNVRNVAIEGSFDDAQAIVKRLFADTAFRDAVGLAAVNSINWVRIAAQTVYFAAAALALGAPGRAVSFAVPTGNFGDIYAAHAARAMGLPIARLLIATNANDILVRALETGRYVRGSARATESPAMDIQVASNFERLLFETSGRDGAAVRAAMAALAQSGGFDIPGPALGAMQAGFEAVSVDDETTRQTIAAVWRESGYLIDPHTAVGIAAARARRGDPAVPMVMLATAHPAKFGETVARATGISPALPERLAHVLDRPERCVTLPADEAKVRAFVLSEFPAAA